MDENILMIGNLIGAILQPLYLCLFMFYTKRITRHRFLFLVLVIIYFMIIQFTFRYDTTNCGDLVLTIMFYLLLKLVYKNKARITDIITYVISYMILLLTCFIVGFISTINIVSLLIQNIMLFLILFIIRNKLYYIENFYNKFWNRRPNNKIKSITVRGFSVSSTIIFFVLSNFWIIYLMAR